MPDAANPGKRGLSPPSQAWEDDADAPLSHREKRLVRGVGVALFAAVLLEKVWLPPIEAPFFVMAALTGWLLVHRYARLSLLRGATYAAIMAIMLVVQLFGPRELAPSYVGLLFFIGLYAPFVFEVPLRRRVYMTIAEVFVLLCAFVGALVLMDWLFQLAGRPMPSLDDVIPAPLRFGGFNYIQHLTYGSPYMKPNGLVMLETSHTSQLLAMGLLAEIVGRQRLGMIAFLLSTQLLSFGGTGILLILLCAPVLAFCLRPRLVLAALIAAPLLLLGAIQVGLVKNFTSRSGELTQNKSSGNARFVEPFEVMAQIVSSSVDNAVFGIGEGNSKFDSRVTDSNYSPPLERESLGGSSSAAMLIVLNPSTKLVIEFGLLVALLWISWFHLILLRSSTPLLVSLAVLIQFDFLNGSLLVPINVAYCWFLSGMYATDRRNNLLRNSAPALTRRAILTFGERTGSRRA